MSAAGSDQQPDGEGGNAAPGGGPPPGRGTDRPPVPASAAEDRAAFGDTVRRKADRRARAQRERRHGVWFGLGMFGLVGWAVAVPTLIGIALGVWLDERFPGGPSWTLTGLLAGVALGSLNAWLWVKRESRHD